MKKKENGITLVTLLVMIVIIIILIFVLIFINRRNGQDPIVNEDVIDEGKYIKELEDGTKLNMSEELNKTKKYKDLEISNIQYTEKNGMTVLLADVKNKGKIKHNVEIVKIEILNENGEIITEGKPVIGEIEPGQTIKLNASLIGDVANANDFRITEVQ